MSGRVRVTGGLRPGALLDELYDDLVEEHKGRAPAPPPSALDEACRVGALGERLRCVTVLRALARAEVLKAQEQTAIADWAKRNDKSGVLVEALGHHQRAVTAANALTDAARTIEEEPGT